METILKKYTELADSGKYEAGAQMIANHLGVKLTVITSEYKKHFADDTNPRWVFKLRLSRGKKAYTFEYGQSIANGGEKPRIYDVLSCLQKHTVGTFDDFCADFGYDNDSRKAEKIYKAVCKEYNAMQRLFTSDELELLNEIQ